VFPKKIVNIYGLLMVSSIGGDKEMSINNSNATKNLAEKHYVPMNINILR